MSSVSQGLSSARRLSHEFWTVGPCLLEEASCNLESYLLVSATNANLAVAAGTKELSLLSRLSAEPVTVRTGRARIMLPS